MSRGTEKQLQVGKNLNYLAERFKSLYPSHTVANLKQTKSDTASTYKACSASVRQGLNSEPSVWRTLSFNSFDHPGDVLLAQFNLYVHKRGTSPIPGYWKKHYSDVHASKANQ